MGYTVKEADLQKERHIMVAILENNRNVPGFDFNKRFEWIYLNNPTGRARAWIIWDDSHNVPVGFTGVFPRKMYVEGREYTAWNCGDFSIEKKYRTLGVAVKLRKAAREAVNNDEVPFLYAHPNERMELIHLRSGHKKIALMKRYALPFRVNRVLQNYLKSELLARMVAKPINFVLSLKYRFSTFLGLSGSLHDRVQVDERHAYLFEYMKKKFRVIGDRSIEFINWKFGANPNRHYEQFDMYYKNNLVGTVFFTRKNDVIHIIDILIDDFDRFAGQLFRMFINAIRPAYRRRIVSLSFIMQEFNPFIPVLEKLGFKFRDDATSAVICYTSGEKHPELESVLYEGRHWFMTVGDRDA